jgi:hypothetical protein
LGATVGSVKEPQMGSKNTDQKKSFETSIVTKYSSIEILCNYQKKQKRSRSGSGCCQGASRARIKRNETICQEMYIMVPCFEASLPLRLDVISMDIMLTYDLKGAERIIYY